MANRRAGAMPAQYRKKPNLVRAMQYDGTPEGEAALVEWICNMKPLAKTTGGMLEFTILAGGTKVNATDWIVCDCYVFTRYSDAMFQANFEATR